MESLLRSGAAPAVIAHRGASALAPENTLPAFQAAWAAGVRWVEADVQLTADDVPIIMHDESLDRTTTGSGPVRAQTAFTIAGLDAGGWFGLGSGRPFIGTRVPELSQLLDTLSADRSLLLEIKGEHTREQVSREIEVLRASGWDDRVFLQSFEIPALRQVRAISPKRPVGLLVEHLHADPVAVCRDLGAVAYNPEHALLRNRPDLVAELHAAGIAVFVWTADDPADWRFLTGLGVDGIITNTPAELLAELS